MSLPLVFRGYRMGHSWVLHGPPVGLPSTRFGSPMDCPWIAHGFSWASMGLQWGSMGLEWGSHGVPTECAKHSSQKCQYYVSLGWQW